MTIIICCCCCCPYKLNVAYPGRRVTAGAPPTRPKYATPIIIIIVIIIIIIIIILGLQCYLVLPSHLISLSPSRPPPPSKPLPSIHVTSGGINKPPSSNKPSKPPPPKPNPPMKGSNINIPRAKVHDTS